jgi:hypothetical protein
LWAVIQHDAANWVYRTVTVLLKHFGIFEMHRPAQIFTAALEHGARGNESRTLVDYATFA